MISDRRLLVPIATLALAAAPLATSHAQVSFERAGYRLTSIGERISVSGRVVDARRRPVASTSIRWRVADPTIATVTPQGVLVSRRPGNTKLWAVTGEDSASALILVDQWAAKFDFIPATLRLDAVGAKAPLRIIVRDAGGHPIASQNRRPTSCRSINERVAALGANGEVTARTNGVTYVRCADRGIADSVRVEVRQRPAKAFIVDKVNLGSKVLGDTFRIHVSATDATGDRIPNVQATWASLNPTIVSVDPLSGLARSVGAGTARVVAQAGDVTDTVSIQVAPGVGLAVPVNADPANDAIAASRVPTLKIDAVYPFEGDTTPVRVVARDAAGVEVPNPVVTLRSTDESIFSVVAGHRLAPKKAGTAWLMGRFGETVDSAQIIVRARSSARVANVSEQARLAFRRPTYDTATIFRSYRRVRQSIRDSIFDSSRVLGLKAPGRLVSLSGFASQAMHSFSDSTGKENRSGFMYGGAVQVAPFRYARLAGEFRTGLLSSSGVAGGNDLTVTEMGGSLTIQPTDNLGFGGTYISRATREGTAALPLATQRWTIVRAFGTVKGQFVGGAVKPYAGVHILLPGSTYTGYVNALGEAVNPEALSLGGEAGVEARTGWFRFALLYEVENFTFPKIGTSIRRDQFSSVGIRFGLEYAR